MQTECDHDDYGRPYELSIHWQEVLSVHFYVIWTYYTPFPFSIFIEDTESSIVRVNQNSIQWYDFYQEGRKYIESC